LPLAFAQALFRRLTRINRPWPAPGLMTAVYLAAGVLSAVNADLYLHLLSAPTRRVVLQDAVAWFLGALLALILGMVVRRLGGGARLKVGFALMMMLLPAARLMVRPTTSAEPLVVTAEPIGAPNRPLLVVGVEGLDLPLLLTYAGGGRTPILERLMNDGGWSTIRPYEPFLRQSYWTTVATGTYPGAHGVKAHRAWQLPWLDEPLRLMPWTPQGSRLILPWSLQRLVTPPAATVPALWQRLRASGVATEVIGWPGFWSESAAVKPGDPAVAPVDLEPDLRWALEVALEPFHREASQIWWAVQRDESRLDDAVKAFGNGADGVWLHPGTLAETRYRLEPLKPRHTGEREVVELAVELLDNQLARLLAAAPPDALVLVVSPYGMSPPSSYERLRRLIGIGDDWRSSGDQCWDGVLMLFGRDVARGRHRSEPRLPDVVPTLCYLLGLPLAQYMEGSVMIDAIDPAYLASHPLVVDR